MLPEHSKSSMNQIDGFHRPGRAASSRMEAIRHSEPMIFRRSRNMATTYMGLAKKGLEKVN